MDMSVGGMQGSRSQPLITNLSNVKASPKWSFKGKARDGRKSETPGPGTYGGSQEASKFTRAPQYGFGCAPRDNLRPMSAPGPGQYHPKDPTQISAQYGFGTAVRKAGAPLRGDMPGPGAYNLGSLVGSEGPKYSAAKRREMNRSTATPGPGTYQPGDGNNSMVGSPPRWGFGTSPREGRTLGAVPGPGAYMNNSTLTGPKYSLRSRLEVPRHQSTPGPGAHGGVYTQFG